MDALRAVCAEIAERARSVRIDEAAIASYAASLPLSGPHATPAAAMLAGDERAGAAGLWLTLDAINFGSGWFPTLRKDPGASGYATIAGAWQRFWATRGPLPPADLGSLTPADLAATLAQNPEHELMELYARSLNDLGDRVGGEYGSWLALVDAAQSSAVALAWRLGEWPCFADRSSYAELSVPFLKRAQIAAADLGRAGVVAWRDAERLTMFADNLVPHVLRLDGVLRFAPELVARIEAGELIEHGCAEEVEIRACAVDAVERIVSAAAAGETPATAAAIDELLWNRGRGARYKAAPRHRSRCTAY